MRTALLGWAQVGKTSLFRALCGPQADSAGFGVHVGVARVPDSRLDAVAEIYRPQKTTPAALEFLDTPPLLNDPEKDAALFGQVRGADGFALLAPLFTDDPDPARDLDRLETEFLLTDLNTATRRLDKLGRDLKKTRTPELEHEHALLEKARAALAAGTPLRPLPLTPDEQKALRGFMLLSAKPLLLVLNAPDAAAPALDRLPEQFGLQELARRPRLALTEVCAKIESELAELPSEDAAEFMASYGLAESARSRVLHAVCALHDLLTFFTVSETECRAWLALRGTLVVEAAGMVHSDFARRFIKAEVLPWQELVEAGGLAPAREHGRVRLEGKEYPVADGDVLYIRHTA